MELWTDEPRRRFTVDEVMQMLRAGILDEDNRIELLGGDLLLVSPNDPPHASTIVRLLARLTGVYAGRGHVRPQLPLDIDATNLPEPDLLVARGEEPAYRDRHPRGLDCILVVEVAWSSLRRALRKAGLYGRAGVLVYWIIDIEKRRLYVHERPKPDGMYTQVRILESDEEVELPEASERWTVAELLPAT